MENGVGIIGWIIIGIIAGWIAEKVMKRDVGWLRRGFPKQLNLVAGKGIGAAPRRSLREFSIPDVLPPADVRIVPPHGRPRIVSLTAAQIIGVLHQLDRVEGRSATIDVDGCPLEFAASGQLGVIARAQLTTSLGMLMDLARDMSGTDADAAAFLEAVGVHASTPRPEPAGAASRWDAAVVGKVLAASAPIPPTPTAGVEDVGRVVSLA